MLTCSHVNLHNSLSLVPGNELSCSLLPLPCTHAHMLTPSHALCTHAHMLIPSHAHMHICTHAHMPTCTHAHLLNAHTLTCSHVHMLTCTHAHMHTCHMLTCTHAHMLTCSHAHMLTCSQGMMERVGMYIIHQNFCDGEDLARGKTGKVITSKV